ncbi:hypothetical protein MY11210_008956 [Beauveria gryllotalpidicola]
MANYEAVPANDSSAVHGPRQSSASAVLRVCGGDKDLSVLAVSALLLTAIIITLCEVEDKGVSDYKAPRCTNSGPNPRSDFPTLFSAEQLAAGNSATGKITAETTTKLTIKIFQANVDKGKEAHSAALQLAFLEGFNVYHPGFLCFSPVDSWSDNDTRPRVMTYVKIDNKLQAERITPIRHRDLLWVRVNGITILNVYNRPEVNDMLPILESWTPPDNCVVAGDMKAFHGSWQSDRPASQDGNQIYEWTEKHDFHLLNEPDEPTTMLCSQNACPRKRRSAEQALVLLQEQIYKAWRSGKVLSLVSFDVKARSSNEPFTIKGREAMAKSSVKLLGMTMDAGLRYKEHVAATASSGLTVAMCLRRLKMVSPRVARQLFTAAVAPVMDYASTVWMHACGARELAWLNRAQMEGARAITGAFRGVATSVAEAEANIQPVQERHAQAAARLWINVRTLPKSHPLARSKFIAKRRFVSPMQKIRIALQRIDTDRLEIIHAYAVAPWHEHVRATTDADQMESSKIPDEVEGIIIATSSSQIGDHVGMGGVVCDTAINGVDELVASYSVLLGSRDEQNPYTAELAAMAFALKCMPSGMRDRDITIMTRNRSAAQVVWRPRQQSGQCTIKQIYGHTERLRKQFCSVSLMGNLSFFLGGKAASDGDKWTPNIEAVKATVQFCNSYEKIRENKRPRDQYYVWNYG